MKKMLCAIAIAALTISPTIAEAKVQFSAYDGPENVATGTGGTKISKNGIDYWTSGTPPRRYQVIGLVTDKRDEEWDGGHAIGSPAVAGKVKKAGGHAVIVQSQTEGGATGGGGFGGIVALGGSKTMTSMLVIRYLDQ